MAAAADDDMTPLDLSIRRKNHNEGIANSPNRNRPRRFPPASLPQQTMGAPLSSTSFKSYGHSQAHQATDAQYFPRGLQPGPGQFFNPENVLHLDPQPTPKPPVPPTNYIWNRNRNNTYSNNPNYNQTATPGNININRNNGPLGFRLPWINPYENYPFQSNLNNNYLLPGAGGQMLMPQLFPFQPNPVPNPSRACHNYGYGYGNSPYEHPHCSHRCEQPASSTCHPPSTHSSFNNCCAQNHSAHYREETQGENGLARNAPEVISLVSTGSIKIDTDDEDVAFLGYGSSTTVWNEGGNENENDRDDERPPVLTPHGPVGIQGPSTNFDDHTDDRPPPQLSPQVPFPGPSSIYPQPESQNTRSDTASNRKENAAVPSGISSIGVSRPGSEWCSNPTEVTLNEPTDKIRVLQFGVSKNTNKTKPSNFEETVSEKSAKSAGEKSLRNSGKGDKASVSVAIPSPRATRGDKGETRKSLVPVKKSNGAASRVQSQRPVELGQDASSGLAPSLSRRKGSSRKRVNWLLVHPETDRNELDSLFGQLE